MHTFMIGSVVISVCIKVSKNVQFSVKIDFRPNKLLRETVHFCLSKGNN